MRHIDEYRDPELTRRLAQEVGSAMSSHEERLRFMEVCGTHTMSIGRHGLRQMLPENLEMLSGPGCPVCVTPHRRSGPGAGTGPDAGSCSCQLRRYDAGAG